MSYEHVHRYNYIPMRYIVNGNVFSYFGKEAQQCTYQSYLQQPQTRNNANLSNSKINMAPIKKIKIKTQKITSVGECVKKLEPSFIAGRNVK